MSIKRLTVAAALLSVLLLSGPLEAHVFDLNNPVVDFSPQSAALVPALHVQPAFDLTAASGVARASAPSMLLASASAQTVATAAAPVTATDATEAASDATTVTDLRKALIAMAMNLRDVRYVRGGHDPATGFDCSGFVRYVFAHAIGMKLPTNSASQFLAGLKVKRADMKPGDLVFFHTHGKHRISHVGIYISDGRFIHSPTTGKSVEISSLNDGYWAKRFAGAKRPDGIAQVADKG